MHGRSAVDILLRLDGRFRSVALLDMIEHSPTIGHNVPATVFKLGEDGHDEAMLRAACGVGGSLVNGRGGRRTADPIRASRVGLADRPHRLGYLRGDQSRRAPGAHWGDRPYGDLVGRGDGKERASLPGTFRLCVARGFQPGRTADIAVGTALTGRPPHRSVREELPHTAPPSGMTVG